MIFAIKNAAVCAGFPAIFRVFSLKLVLTLGFAAVLGACTSLPQQPSRPVTYDLGPMTTPAAGAAPLSAALPALVLPALAAPEALEGLPMLYRLGYADSRELRPYQLSRWAMPPPAMVQQHLRARLAQSHTVLAISDPLPQGAPMLKLELENFVQVHTSPEASSAQVAVRATVFDAQGHAVAQRLFTQTQAAGADAASGAQALAVATDALGAALAAWVQTHIKR